MREYEEFEKLTCKDYSQYFIKGSGDSQKLSRPEHNHVGTKVIILQPMSKRTWCLEITFRQPAEWQWNCNIQRRETKTSLDDDRKDVPLPDYNEDRIAIAWSKKKTAYTFGEQTL